MGISIVIGDDVRHLKFSTFNIMRNTIMEAAMPLASDDPLRVLFNQSDVEGFMSAESCGRIAKRIDDLKHELRVEGSATRARSIIGLIIKLGFELESCAKANHSFSWC